MSSAGKQLKEKGTDEQLVSRKSREKWKTTKKETKLEANACRVVAVRKKAYQHQN
jgi:hypothetical protein